MRNTFILALALLISIGTNLYSKNTKMAVAKKEEAKIEESTINYNKLRLADPINATISEIQKEEDKKISIKFDTRIDAQYNTYGTDNNGNRPEDEGGFAGKYLKLIINGKISPKFSYNFRYRLYTTNNVKEFFGTTDYLNLTWHVSDQIDLTAGKQVVFVGSTEYDYAPIDVYFASDYWNHVSPYQIGLNLSYRTKSKKHTFFAQFVNSPFSSKALENIYAYNLKWCGTIAPWFKTIYSVNMMEYSKGNFMNFIGLGNKFLFNKFCLELDYINRYAGKDTEFFSDFTFIGQLAYSFNNFRVFAKGGYDQNHAQVAGTTLEDAYDKYVLPGVERGFYGLGVEFFPLITENNNLRVHAYWHSNTVGPIPNSFGLGIRWQIKVLDR